MKKSRLLVALLVMLVAAGCSTQDSYRETLKECYQLILSDYIDTEEFKQNFTPIFKQSSQLLFKSGDVDLDQLTDRYMEEGLIDYLVDFILPKMKEAGITEERMKETMALLSTPEGKTYIKHTRQWTEAMKKEYASLFANVADGDSPSVQPREDIDAEYIEKFKQIVNDQTVKSVAPNFDMLSRYLTKFGEKLDVDPDTIKKQTEKMENLKAWMTANMPTIALNSAYGIMTVDDLEFAIANKTYSDDSTFNKFFSTFDSFNPMTFGFDLTANYVEWMQEHGAELQDGAMDMLNQMKEKFSI